MSNDEVKGRAKQIGGQIREGVGKLTGNKCCITWDFQWTPFQ